MGDQGQFDMLREEARQRPEEQPRKGKRSMRNQRGDHVCNCLWRKGEQQRFAAHGPTFFGTTCDMRCWRGPAMRHFET